MSRILHLIGSTLVMFFLSVVSATAADKVVSLSSVSGVQGERIAVDVILGDAANTAGAAFTVTYNKNNLILTKVESTFFRTFTAQNITPTQAVVDNITYNGPVVFNTSDAPAGVMLAAARKENGTGTNASIFTLTFTIATSAPAGSYPLTVIDSTIKNTAAGYNTNGETIAPLVGIDGPSFVRHTVPTRNPGIVTVQPFEDTDGDGINDNWELANVLPGIDPAIALTIFSATGDVDKDGYTDLQEYENRGITDPAGALFDPMVVNAPNGTGYVDSDSAFWNLMLPAILNNAREADVKSGQ